MSWSKRCNIFGQHKLYTHSVKYMVFSFCLCPVVLIRYTQFSNDSISGPYSYKNIWLGCYLCREVLKNDATFSDDSISDTYSHKNIWHSWYSCLCYPLLIYCTTWGNIGLYLPCFHLQCRWDVLLPRPLYWSLLVSSIPLLRPAS